MRKEIRNHFERMALEREIWEKKNFYYYSQISHFMKQTVPPGKRVLEIGCGRGSLLKSLNPSFGVGIDFSYWMIKEAKEKFKEGLFAVSDAQGIALKAKFDYIILTDVLGHLEDIQKVLEEIRDLCTKDTKIIITYFNYIYEPILRFAERLSLKMPEQKQSWISFDDVNSFLSLAGFEIVQRGRMILFPKNIPVISAAVNRFLARLPILNHFCITQFWVGKLSAQFLKREHDYSVSVIVPARNEKGNIEQIVHRIPKFAKDVEIVFVEGRSKDGTREEILRVQRRYPDYNIKFLEQNGKGKADAVIKGMDNAKGDILMILDADMTVTPEELPKFYRALIQSNADLVMGSRLVYPMESRAMQFLNKIGNKAFGLIMSWIIGQRVKDTLCGTKVLFREKYIELKNRSKDLIKLDPFGDFFFILGTARNSGKIVEIPIRYKERSYGKTNISRFKHGFYLLKMCFVAAWKIKFN